MTFEDLNIIEPICKALKTKNYITPSPIQQKAIPYVMEGRDVFGVAQTGTGKTAAFALPILQKLHIKQQTSRESGIKALILAPTRELVIQISENFAAYGRDLTPRHTTIYGGVSQHHQVKALQRGVDIVIATPGRLMDLMNQGFVKLNNIEFFVLDEADRMLDMGFIADIKRIIAKIPAKRQTVFFSATVPTEIKKFADSLLTNPITVQVTPISSAAVSVKQSVYYVEKHDKNALLQHVLNSNSINHALVFTRTKRGADKVAKDLNKNGILAEAIHGNKSQNARQKALIGFKNRTIRILVATDIASRGIDVDKLSHVINYELPEQAETYVHRIGRTGRAGESGIALSFCASDERDSLKDINKLLTNKIEVVSALNFTPPKLTFAERNAERSENSFQRRPTSRPTSRPRSTQPFKRRTS